MKWAHYAVTDPNDIAAVEQRRARYERAMEHARSLRARLGADELLVYGNGPFRAAVLFGAKFAKKAPAGWVRSKNDPPNLYRPGKLTAAGKSIEGLLGAHSIDEPWDLYQQLGIAPLADRESLAFPSFALVQGTYVVTVPIGEDTPEPRALQFVGSPSDETTPAPPNA